MGRALPAFTILLIGSAAVLVAVLSGDGALCEIAVTSETTSPVRPQHDRGPTAGATVSSASFAPLPTPGLRTVTTGERGELLLEWTGGPDNATRWQYRQQGPENDWVWTRWTDVPGSDASTRSFCATGLEDYTAYYFKVRAVMATGALMYEGSPSAEARGVVPEIDSHGIPIMPSGQVVEGGRTWRVSFSLVVIDVPGGVRLMFSGGGGGAGTGLVEVDVRDVESGSWFTMDANTGEMLSRTVVTTPALSRDVDAVFDWIAASARVRPRTGAVP